VVTIANVKMLFLSGTATIGEAPFDIRKQTEIVFRKMSRLLEEQGAGLSDLVKITAFLTDIREYDAYNEVRNRIFGEFATPSASSSVEAKLIYPELRIEIEGLAVIEAPSAFAR